MDKDLGQIFTELKNDVTTYVEVKTEILKLTLYEKAGKLVSSLSYVLVLVVLAFVATLFLFISLGVLIGQWLDSTSAGIAVVGGIYLILIGILIMNKKKFTASIMNNVIDALTDEEEELKG